MTWRLRVQHRTGFRYDGEVQASYNEARMTPETSLAQTTLDAQVLVSPHASTYRYWDYWGTLVTAFSLLEPHAELVVTASSVVETATVTGLEDDALLDWDALGSEQCRDRYTELLTATPLTEVDEDLVQLAAEAAGALEPDDAARAVADLVRSQVAYVPGATEVTTNAREVWQAGKGVCQDLAHVTVGALRTLGIPARYVSGYLHPKADAAVGETVQGQSHAWVEWWAGRWTAYDPTNGIAAADQHVVVARGRDYKDVTPLKGIYSGAPSTALGVTVDVTRLA